MFLVFAFETMAANILEIMLAISAAYEHESPVPKTASLKTSLD